MSYHSCSELKAVLTYAGVSRVEQVPAGHWFELELSRGVDALCGELMARRVAPSGLEHALFAYNRFWSLTDSAAVRLSDHAAAVRRVHDELVRAVHMRLDVCDVALGCLLSGGLDSSIVSAVTARHIKQHGTAWMASGARLHTFAVGQKGSPDLAAARVVGEPHANPNQLL